MKRLLTLLLVLACSLAGAKTYTYGAWSFELPNGARESVDGGVRAFGYDGVVYLFTPPEALSGRTLENVANAAIADLTRNQTSGVKLVAEKATGDGGTLLAYSGAVTDPKTGTARIQSYFFFERAGLWGLALAMVDLDADADVGKALSPLGSVKFSPSANLAGNLAPGQIPAPRLPAPPWSSAPAGRTATSRPGLDFPAARKLGLDPDVDLLPDAFECYLGKTDDDEGRRPMTPTPDLRVVFSRDGSYTYDDGAARSSGRWAQKLGDDKRKLTTLSGPLLRSGYGIYLYDEDAGQHFIATQASSGREVHCYQAGPRAEALRLELTKLRIGDGPLSCVDADGGPAYPLTFSGSGGQMTYSTPKGNGRVRTSFSVSSGGWSGQAGFGGGPFDLGEGEMTEDQNGNRTLEISESTTTREGIFYSETNTRRIALCRARVAPRPDVLYGQTPAPKTGVSGGPDGLFVSSQSVVRYIGNFFNTTYEAQLSLFTPGGYVLTDLDPDELGALPDCARTKPNGDPFCGRYGLKSGALLMPRESKAKAYTPAADGFRLGDASYYRAAPPTARSLAGVYDSSADSSSGAQGGGTDIGTYNSLSSGYRFTADGQFSWKYSSSSSTLISPNAWGNINGVGVTGGGSSSSSGGGQGTYILDGHWLTLNFSDGRKLRHFVYQQPSAIFKDDPTLGDRLNIGGAWLKRVGKP